MPAARTTSLRERVRRFTRSQSESEALDLIRDAADAGAITIADAPQSVPVTLCGRIRSITVQPSHSRPALEVDLYDGSGHLSLVWLGRRRIRGIEPGRTIVVHGRVTSPDGMPTMFNPRYELRPGSGSS